MYDIVVLNPYIVIYVHEIGGISILKTDYRVLG